MKNSTSTQDTLHLTGPGKHLNFARGSYLESTSRPLYALLFLLPLVIVYEIGALTVNTDQIAHTQSRVATFTWLLAVAQWIGMNRTLIWAFPGLVVALILFCWHMVSHDPWHVRVKWIGGMAVESVLMTLPLFLLGSIMQSSLNFAAASPVSSYLADLTTSIGAGIYEELVFRFILMGLIIMFMEDLVKAKKTTAVFVAVGLSALLFAAHHYVGIENGHFRAISSEQFTAPSFIFRTMAGVYFALLFRYRGFGIIAGTHAAYDMINFTLKLF